MGESPNPVVKNMNHPLNPLSAFDYFTILKGERLGILLVEATENEITLKVISGIGTQHYTNKISKKTPV